MRIRKKELSADYKIAVVDDEIGIIDAITAVLGDYGYKIFGFTDALEAIEEFKRNKYDLLILDYLMEVMRGDKVVEKIREFDEDLYILLLTGHKDIAPPLETLNNLDIQGYCEKTNKFDQLILLITSALKSVAQTKTIRSYKEGLDKVLKAIPDIYKLRKLESILDYILKGVIRLVPSNNAFILIDDINDITYEKHKSILKGIGEFDVEVDNFMTMLSPENMEKIGYCRSHKVVTKLDNGAVIPLINEKGNIMGVVYVEGVDIEDRIRLLEIFASHVAISLRNSFLHTELTQKNDELINTYDKLNDRYVSAIELLRQAVDAKDVYTRGHSDRVSYLSVKIGEKFDLREEDLEKLRLGGIFHDVGKIGTSDDILFKTDSLSPEEYDEVKRHTITGSYMLSVVSMFEDIVPIIKYHHERIDGRGYPEGLRNDEIPFLARIIAVADAFDAMTSDRLYRKRIELDKATEQLISGSGTQFDPDVVKKFLLVLENFESISLELAHTHE